MFEVGFTELILICGLALIVLGPQRLPQLAQQIGRWVGRARAMARQLRDQLDQEVSFQDDATRRRTTPSIPPEEEDLPLSPHHESSAPTTQEPEPATADPSHDPQTPHERHGP